MRVGFKIGDWLLFYADMLREMKKMIRVTYVSIQYLRNEFSE